MTPTIDTILAEVEKLPITRTFTFAAVGEPAARSVRYCEITTEQRDAIVAEVRRLRAIAAEGLRTGLTDEALAALEKIVEAK